MRNILLVNFRRGQPNVHDFEKMNSGIDYYNSQRLDTDNETIGIIIGKLKNDIVVEYTLPEDNEQIFASQYKTVLPNKEKLKALLSKY